MGDVTANLSQEEGHFNLFQQSKHMWNLQYLLCDNILMLR